MKKNIIALSLLLFFLGCVSSSDISVRPIACTADEKTCPDGTSVSRIPPACAFAPCPEMETRNDSTEIEDESIPPQTIPAPPMPTETSADDKPVLYHLGINFGPWNKQTDKAGDFLFVKGLFDDKIFMETGTYVVGSTGPKLIPEFTYHVPNGTNIVSPVKGVIMSVRKMYSDDYAVNIQTQSNSEWLVTFEHLENVVVQEGESVEVGTILGEASTFGGLEEMSFTEIVVWKGGPTEKDIIKICPITLLDDSVKTKIEGEITQLAKDWETFMKKNIYDEEAWTTPGCLKDQLTEYEAMNPPSV